MLQTIYAQKLTGDGARDGEAYVVRAPILNNADPTDDGFGQVGMAYDPAANQFEVAVVGTSPSGGLPPLWRFRLASDAVAKNMSPVRVDSATPNRTRRSWRTPLAASSSSTGSISRGSPPR